MNVLVLVSPPDKRTSFQWVCALGSWQHTTLRPHGFPIHIDNDAARPSRNHRLIGQPNTSRIREIEEHLPMQFTSPPPGNTPVWQAVHNARTQRVLTTA